MKKTPLVQKKKICKKGTGKAIGVNGCGKEAYLTYGLCTSCLHDFIFETDAGKLVLKKSISLGKKKTEAERKKSVREEKNKLREKLKTLTEYENEAKKSFQRYVRLRDAELPCISCGTQNTKLWDGGHWKKAEVYSGLIFDERNCQKQCRKCNRFLGGNEGEYRIGLVNRFGEDFVKQLEEDANAKRNYKYTKSELSDLKKKYDAECRKLLKMA